MKQIRGQSITEFLMTYGWIVLALLMFIALLFHLGLLNPSGMAPTSCTLPPGFSCQSYSLGPNGTLQFDLGQTTGKRIRVTGLGCSKADAPAITTPVNILIDSGSHKSLTSGIAMKCLEADDQAPSSSRDYFKGKISINYTEVESGLKHTLVGDIAVRYEPDLGTPTPVPIQAQIISTCPFTIRSPGTYVLNGDIAPCPGGITITSRAPGATLDCLGNKISSQGNGWDAGIHLQGAVNATVKNCIVHGYYYGIQVDSGSINNTIIGNTADASRHNALIIGGPTRNANNTITGNSFTGSSAFGVQVENNSFNNLFTDNLVCNNAAGSFNCTQEQAGGDNTCSNPNCPGLECPNYCP